MSHGCQYWVWLKGRACADCLANGRPDEGPFPDEGTGQMARMREDFRVPQDIYVPKFEDGTLLYTLMQIVATSDFDGGWTVKEVPISILPATAEPVPVTPMATTGLSSPKVSQTAQDWTGNEGNLEWGPQMERLDV
jgi:hypothetical protein